MKKKLFAIISFLAVPVVAIAQDDSAHGTVKQVKEDFKEAGTEIKETAVQVGNKAAEIGVNAFSTVKDTRIKDKTGPNGQPVYIDSRSRYYYINERGKKVYIHRSELKNKE